MAQPEICIDVTVMRKKIWHIFLKIREIFFLTGQFANVVRLRSVGFEPFRNFKEYFDEINAYLTNWTKKGTINPFIFLW